MTLFRLLIRNLRHFRWSNAAVTAGMAVATAVLVGALLVGDSVRGSLRDLAEARLGPIDYALVSPMPFDESLATRITQLNPSVDTRDSPDAIPGLIVLGGASDQPTDSDALPRRAGDVQIVGLSKWADVPRGRCILNGRRADELRVRAGDRVILSMPRMGNVPLDSALARRDRGDVLARLPLTVERVVRDGRFLDLFSLTPSQRPPRNAWVNLAELQDTVGQKNRANVLFVSLAESVQHDPEYLNFLNEQGLAAGLTLDDLGLSLRPAREIASASASPAVAASAPDESVLESQFTFLHPAIVKAAERAAAARGIPFREVTVSLAETVETESFSSRPSPSREREKEIHYAIVAGVSDLPADLGGAIPDGQVAVNHWAATQLDAAPDSTKIQFSFYRRRPDGSVMLDNAGPFTVRRILPMSGLGADRTLTPSFEGLTDKSRISDWKPPTGITIDQGLADEDYWEEYQAAPKLFINLDTARRLWGDKTFGVITSVRVPASQADDFRSELLRQFDPASIGLQFTDIRSGQLQTASGTTDFAQLFVGFSFFIIVAAVLLTALLFRLNIEQRARQIGLLGALGFTPRHVLRLHLAEGAAMSLAGGIIGLAGGVGYCSLIMAALRTWWLPAIGTTSVSLHVTPASLAIGLAAGVAIAMLAVLFAVLGVSRISPAGLLAGNMLPAVRDVVAREAIPCVPASRDSGSRLNGRSARTKGSARRPNNRLLPAVSILAVLAAAGVLVAGAAGEIANQVAFMFAGGMLLVAAILTLAWRWRAAPVRPPAALAGPAALLRLAFRNAARHPGRSVLAVSLLAFASFVLVIVASMRQSGKGDSGGGFALMLTSNVPLTGDLNTPAGRRQVGITGSDDAIWSRATFTQLRRRAGQDASCRNMTYPASPTILGVPRTIARGGFEFDATTQQVNNPWTLLAASQPDGAISFIADAATAEYSLHLPIGGTMTVRDDFGNEVPLRLVATLRGSVFQGELLVSEQAFREWISPGRGGFGVVLVQAPADATKDLQTRLARDLGEMGVTIDRPADLLAEFAQVENTYLSTFESLGGLGLLLGTVGLAVVLVRSVLERKRELALLAAIGFSPAGRLLLVLAENALLLVLGLGIGTATALIGVLPTLLAGREAINIGSLSATLVVIVLAGLAALTLAAVTVGRRFVPADLRAE
jgi:putative ABC transport system permease protein